MSNHMHNHIYDDDIYDDDIDDDHTISKSYYYLYIILVSILALLILIILTFQLYRIKKEKICVEKTCYTKKMNPNTEYIPELCTICLNIYERNEFISTLKCDHSFHAKCIKEWYNIRNSDTEYAYCPCCNEEFIFA